MFCEVFEKTNNCDWELTFSIIKDVGLLFIAYLGLRTWQKQFLGKIQFEFVSKANMELSFLYEEIKNFRFYEIKEFEIKEALNKYNYEDLREDSKITHLEKRVVFLKRSHGLSEKLREIKDLEYEISSLWGEDYRLLLSNLHDNVGDIIYAITDYIKASGKILENKDNNNPLEKGYSEIKELEKILTGSKDDDYDKSIKSQISYIREKLNFKTNKIFGKSFQNTLKNKKHFPSYLKRIRHGLEP